MGAEVKSKKRKAGVPDDEAAKVKKAKQMTADVLPKKRRAVDEPDSTITKKLKAPQPGPIEGAKSTSAEKSHPPQTAKPELNGNSAALEKPKASSDVKAFKKLRGVQGSIKLKSTHGKAKNPDLTLSALKGDGGDTPTTDDSDDSDDSNDAEIDDQTEALLKGFESDDDSVKHPDDQGYEVGNEIPKLGKKLKRRAIKAAEKDSASGRPGVVYIGRIPHGFYEQEMKQYFSQFGNITNLRLSRNRKTGKSKHFAFVEFESAEVAEIVSKTMDNYLLFGHILKCKLVAPAQVHKDLWIGANKRFKSVPRNKIQGRQLSQAMTVEGWQKRMAVEEKRRADKKEAMKLMDYEFESPKLKSPKDALKKKQQALTKPVSDDESDQEADEKDSKSIEAPKKTENQAMTTKSKKEQKQKNSIITAEKAIDGDAEAAEDPCAITIEPSKKKRNKKVKSSQKLDGVEEPKQIVSAKHADAGSVKKGYQKYRASS